MFICMQKKINFIAHYFLEILQRYCIVVILSTVGCTHQICQYQLFEYFEVYLCRNQLYFLLLSHGTAKILPTRYLEYSEQDQPYSPILIVSTCRKVCLSACKKSTFSLFFNWDSLHARLKSHYDALSYKKKKHKKDYSIEEICSEKNLQLKGVC